MTTTNSTDRAAASRYDQAAIEADPTVPAIHIWRDFDATPDRVMRAHTDPELFAQWVGPDSLTTRIDHWDCRTLGAYRFVNVPVDGGDEEYAFRGTFAEVGEHRIVQTFCYEGMPEAIALETLTLTDLGDGRTRLHAFSLCDSFEGRDGMLASGMEVGVNDGYAKLERLLAAGVA
ncbi:SRPBCC family protein [Nocardioides solisilvae]|uniref:SRPBCC family protein n=1 Tax=Nocardioides solisilvae TaxID=1542435 RepID=UPI000D7502F5|nr:SRPBCC family protein [Nocardioides solisilvae]